MPDFPVSPKSGFSYTLPFFSRFLSSRFFFFFFKYLLCAPGVSASICFLFFIPFLHISTPPSFSPCSRVLALVVMKAALPLKIVCLNEKGGCTQNRGGGGSQLKPIASLSCLRRCGPGSSLGSRWPGAPAGSWCRF